MVQAPRTEDRRANDRHPLDRSRSNSQGTPLMTSPLQQKLKINGPVVITANRLGDGAVVYRTTDGRWSTALDDAAVVTTAPAATGLLTAASADSVVAVGAYVAPVRLDPEGRLHPGNLRESIRSKGPTVGAAPAPAPVGN
jgi:hypothetical protein